MIFAYRRARSPRAAGLPLVVAWLLVTSSVHAEPPSPRDVTLSAPIARAELVQAVVARSPAVRAAGLRARAAETAADGEGRLPAPEAMAQAWQIPLARPASVHEAQMVMVGVSQSFPAPGSLAARSEAMREEARAGQAAAEDRARLAARDAEHAFADYVEATARHRIHAAHLEVAAQVLSVAQRRQAAGGPVTDVAQAEVERARVQADLLGDAALLETARARINALLERDPASPLGPPVEGDAEVPAWTRDELLARARRARPELLGAAAQEEASRDALRAAEREATWPSFSIGLSYFAPTASSPFHGYGVNAGMSLPWIGGAADRRRDAQRQLAQAASTEVDGLRVQVDADVVAAESGVRAAAVRWQVQREQVLPASRRAYELAWGGYEAGRTDLLVLLAAQRAVVDADHDLVMSRAALDHAFADLDAAVGAAVPRRPVGALTEPEAHHG